MSESQHERARRSEEEAEQEPTPATQSQGEDEEIDSLLDEIDSVLESNAAEFVRSFVQKGGE